MSRIKWIVGCLVLLQLSAMGALIIDDAVDASGNWSGNGAWDSVDMVPQNGTDYYKVLTGANNTNRRLYNAVDVQTLQAGTYIYEFDVGTLPGVVPADVTSDARLAVGFYNTGINEDNGADLRNAINSFHSGDGITLTRLQIAQPANGSWEHFIYQVDVATGSSLVGSEFGFGFGWNAGTGGRGVAFDGLEVTYAIPEPQALGLITVVASATLFIRRVMIL